MFNATKKALIWTMALAIPFQGLPALSCGCTASREAVDASTLDQCANELAASSRCAGHSCCSSTRHQATMCCCRGKAKCECHNCTCGLSCPCQQTKQSPPTAPPVEQRSLGKVLTLGLASASTAAAVPVTSSQRSITALATCDAMSGAARCISLCRFTL